ncbi:GDP-mannose 4,6-dehydratase [Candidatus Kaiserbacteria bacterium RIFCSPHIGHO2_01_FULL_50_13]|uniref:GDP-mannose 4,6-dehydratase n=1 Tax=Candidatus Kaiserbacteria bacterium RIFCSPLOWO2_01_FULL_50_24 TaxID=1798507 RepID=A0A1F6EIU2_9BACT|nr:MAG: GDP-mannose 4,6-dehydratase [Candidatus Kaiserbacteria bacterium RIFCSPHIGHO2_01_FULL_50_13]OGG73563.1 MAG: GDP-mannose 4,6-dehydratase [Candidatus Kaiserbacteria bacterium RIFCSPLOWO2_01_FULL_50_24]OGG82186.1 MAG: GDP-mannose 4,6-dehydratase [Candidatus Kaiserbacteria bacterium RIFCSPLOWO2_02_FULL_51_13]
MAKKRRKTAIITGVTGQDGSYMAELLLSKEYEVYGLMRRVSTWNSRRIDHLLEHPHFHKKYGDLDDHASLIALTVDVKPDEFYNFGAMSQVRISFEIPRDTITTNTLGVLTILDAIRRFSPKTRFYQASSSEMFGEPGVPVPFNEKTPMIPQNPYGVSKLAAYHLTQQYRHGYGLFATTGILFNHESPRRGENFVTKKVTQAVARIKKGKQNFLMLGNLDAKRDWGWAPEFVEAIHTIMRLDKPDVFVVATGETHSIREFVEEAFGHVGLDWKKFVKIQEDLKRPNDVPLLLGDATKMRRATGWKPKMKFKDIVREMVKYDLEHV